MADPGWARAPAGGQVPSALRLPCALRGPLEHSSALAERFWNWPRNRQKSAALAEVAQAGGDHPCARLSFQWQRHTLKLQASSPNLQLGKECVPSQCHQGIVGSGDHPAWGPLGRGLHKVTGRGARGAPVPWWSGLGRRRAHFIAL